MKRIASIACLFAAVALLAGCPKKNTTHEPPVAGSRGAGLLEYFAGRGRRDFRRAARG